MSRDEIVRYLGREAGLSAQAAERAFEAMARLVGEGALLALVRSASNDPFALGADPAPPAAPPSFPDEPGTGGVDGADEAASDGPHGPGGGSEL